MIRIKTDGLFKLFNVVIFKIKILIIKFSYFLVFLIFGINVEYFLYYFIMAFTPYLSLNSNKHI